MGRLKIRHKKGQGGDKRRTIWSILSSLEVPIHKLIPTGDYGYVAIADDYKIEELTREAAKRRFDQHGLEILDPPELSAKRTLVLTQVDEHIHTMNTQDIKENIEKLNTHIKVTTVIKIPKAPSIIKVKLETSAMVQKCLQSGILISYQSFPPHALKQDTYVHIPQCTRCYSYEHTLQQCTFPDTYTICSSCGSTTHKFYACNNAIKQCLTCNTKEHPTNAARCPARKELTKKLAKELRQQTTNTPTYANITKNTKVPLLPTPPTTQVLTPNPTQTLKHLTIINTALTMANIREASNPGTFQHTLDEIYKANGLPSVIIPPTVIDTQTIQAILNNSTLPPTQSEDMDAEEYRNKRTHDSDSGDDTEHKQKKQPPKAKRTETKKVTIQIITPEHNTMSDKDIHTNFHSLLESGDVKYIYTDNIPDDQVEHMITHGQIDITQAPIQRATPSNYRKTQTGYYETRKYKPTDTPHWTVHSQ